MQPGFSTIKNAWTCWNTWGSPAQTVAQRGLGGLPARVEKVYNQSNPRKGGRPSFDAVLMFKGLVLQDFYKLPDDLTESDIRDRYSFCSFLGLSWKTECWIPRLSGYSENA